MWKRVYKIWIPLLVGIYLLLTLFLYFNQEKMLFFPQPIRGSNANMVDAHAKYAVEEVHDGVHLRGWFVKQDAFEKHPLVVYYGGNGEELSNKLYGLEKYGPCSFLLVNYRGYGASEGKPGEQELFSDALYLYDKLVAPLDPKPASLVLAGRSLGCGVAIHVASRRPADRMLLISPYDSIESIACRQYFFLPVKPLLRHRFHCMSNLGQIDLPLLAVTGTRDGVIDIRHSRRVIDAWKNKEVQHAVVEGAGHNDLGAYEDYWRPIRAFLAEAP
ncbi:MAG: alpha/beta hydrolase [Verrucomicrobiota bacterium]